MDAKAKRYTLTLPPKLHDELSRMAEDRGASAKDIVVKCLKLGMIALSIEDDPEKDLILREQSPHGVQETRLLIF